MRLFKKSIVLMNESAMSLPGLRALTLSSCATPMIAWFQPELNSDVNASGLRTCPTSSGVLYFSEPFANHLNASFLNFQSRYNLRNLLSPYTPEPLRNIKHLSAGMSIFLAFVLQMRTAFTSSLSATNLRLNGAGGLILVMLSLTVMSSTSQFSSETPKPYESMSVTTSCSGLLTLLFCKLN